MPKVVDDTGSDFLGDSAKAIGVWDMLSNPFQTCV
jgi:hypothetical protein